MVPGARGIVGPLETTRRPALHISASAKLTRLSLSRAADEHGTELDRRATGKITYFCRVYRCQCLKHALVSESSSYDYGAELYRRAAGEITVLCRV